MKKIILLVATTAMLSVGLPTSAQFNSANFVDVDPSDSKTIEELLKKIPGVEIDSEGNITVNGKDVSKILVNGKPLFNDDDDNTAALTQPTANLIEKVGTSQKEIICEVVEISEEVETETAKLKPFDCNVANLMNVSRLFVWKKYLIVYNPTGNNILHFLNRKTGKYICSTGVEGNGPDDFASPIVPVSMNIANDRLSIFEMDGDGGYSIFKLDVKKGKPFLKRESRGSFNQSFSNHLLIFDDGTKIIADEHNYRAMYVKISADDKQSEKWLDFPNMSDRQYKVSSFPSWIVRGPDNKFATIYEEYPMISIQTTKDESDRRFYSLPEWTGQYHSTNGSALKECYFSTCGFCADSKYIYALYSGQEWQADPITAQSIGNILSIIGPSEANNVELHVWDWNGKLVKRISLDQYVDCVTCDPKTGLLYLANTGGFAVYTLDPWK